MKVVIERQRMPLPSGNHTRCLLRSKSSPFSFSSTLFYLSLSRKSETVFHHMKTFFLSLMTMFSFPLFAQPDNRTAGQTAETVQIDPTLRYQQLEGWGSSLCWWAAQVGNWTPEKVDSIVDLLTSPDKLNMNIFRYNIGGGDDPSHADGHMVKGKGKRAEMEGFKASPTADYNWEADRGQRTILLKIKEKRPDAVFEAFSNSAPYWMTYSGCAAGHADPSKDNLKPEYYELFCDYLIDVCKHYQSAYQRNIFRRLYERRQIYIRNGCQKRQESTVSVRSQEPCSRTQRRRTRPHGGGHRQRGIRLRRRKMHGASRSSRAGGYSGRTRSKNQGNSVKPQSRTGLRQDQQTGSGLFCRAQAIGNRLDRKGAFRGRGNGTRRP